MTDDLREALRAELPLALRARDRVRIAVLRTTLGALANAEAVDDAGHGAGRGVRSTEVPRRHLDDDAVRAIVTRERDELAASAQELAALGQAAVCADLRRQADLLTDFLGDAPVDALGSDGTAPR